MYKLLLSCRYLRTRFIALASIISVMLGVATMIVVNSVMEGFRDEMESKIHGAAADLTVASRNQNDGFYDMQRRIDEINEVVGDKIEALTAKVETPTMLSINVNGQVISHPVRLVGIDPKTFAKVSEFQRYLQHPKNRQQVDFKLREGGYDTKNHNSKKNAAYRKEMDQAGWQWRRLVAQYANKHKPDPDMLQDKIFREREWKEDNSGTNISQQTTKQQDIFDPQHDQHTGVILGIGLAKYRYKLPDGSMGDHFLVRPGDDVRITMPPTGVHQSNTNHAISHQFTIVDYYESSMAEYDSAVAFVSLNDLQKIRGMIDMQTGVASATAIQIKLKEGVKPSEVKDLLIAATKNGVPIFPQAYYVIQTWRDQQGPLLSAVQLETTILNILLFLIIAVAGFGILATFYMIVVEKTKDIGILKSLGASNLGIMSIFLSYGVALGSVGAGIGAVMGIIFVKYINTIRVGVEWLTGQEVFDPSIYYFSEIPTILNPFTITWVVLGAVGVAILASVMPAIRASSLHPVKALRYE